MIIYYDGIALFLSGLLVFAMVLDFKKILKTRQNQQDFRMKQPAFSKFLGYWILSLCFISLGIFLAIIGFRNPWKIFNNNRLDYSLYSVPLHGFALGIMSLAMIITFSLLLGRLHLVKLLSKKNNTKDGPKPSF